MEEKLYWIWLSQIPYIGPVTANRLLKQFKTPETIYYAEEKELLKTKILTVRQLNSLIEYKSLQKAEQILEECEEKRIKILTADNHLYSKKARKPKDAPILLYYRGLLKELQDTVGIVGARRCTAEIRRRCVEEAEQIIKKGATIVSGMAKGIDACASTVSINEGKYTIAVVANGLDICYPSEHQKLMDRIIEQGLLLSEYPPETKPTKYQFPLRNRIISAWSDKLIVIAPGKGSGALITAEYMRTYGREVEIIEKYPKDCECG